MWPWLWQCAINILCLITEGENVQIFTHYFLKGYWCGIKGQASPDLNFSASLIVMCISVLKKKKKNVITVFLSSLEWPNHLDGAGGLQRMVGRGGGLPLPLPTFLTFLWSLWWQFLRNFSLSRRLQCSTLWQAPHPQALLLLHTWLFGSVPACVEERRAAFSVGRQEDAQASSSFVQVVISEKGHLQDGVYTDKLTELMAISVTALTLPTC